MAVAVYCYFSCSHPQFFAAFQIVAPLEDTCVEIYSVDSDLYTKEAEVYLEMTFDTYTFTSSVSINTHLRHRHLFTISNSETEHDNQADKDCINSCQKLKDIES